MPSKTWKSVERQVATWWGTRRNPLSGINSGHTGSDTLHKHLYIETKYRKRSWITSLFNQVKEQARKESKLPVVCIKGKGQAGFLVVMQATDIEQVLKEKELLN